jgi:hypothetical protein
MNLCFRWVHTFYKTRNKNFAFELNYQPQYMQCHSTTMTPCNSCFFIIYILCVLYDSHEWENDEMQEMCDTATPAIGWLPKLVQTVWTGKSGPNNLVQIWTKSGPNLDRFLKNGCRNSRQDTAPTYKGITTKHRCEQKGVRDTHR